MTTTAGALRRLPSNSSRRHASSSSGSGSGSLYEVQVGLVQETCGFYEHPTGSECRRPRTCRDCLNRIVSGEPQGCMLDMTGRCTSMITPAPSNSTQFFVSGNTTYCAASNDICRRCPSSASFCRGADGCVCIPRCESVVWNRTFNGNCTDKEVPVARISSNNDTNFLNNQLWISIFMAVCVGMPLGILLYRHIVKTHHQPDPILELSIRATRRQIRSASKHGTLQLSGWHAMRQNLIDDEQQRFEEVGDGVTLRHASTATAEQPAEGENQLVRPVQLTQPAQPAQPAQLAM
ncbi:TPA: hypothetical protein N0F65_012858 [Lagenidium giganteum]|uniref:TNFR-Cys domain-containing protein n=1 Tax=Lagenidium giganteum TaxID=4803 RepID=A0AAV2YL26_9STRA|nr:TPA: hypothetical protein N0F65_012858 [Lagenidium giganteum]